MCNLNRKNGSPQNLREHHFTSHLINFSTLVGTVQGPEDFEPSRLLMISMISWGVVGENKNDCEIQSFR